MSQKRSKVNAAWRDIKVELMLWHACARGVTTESEPEARERLLNSYDKMLEIRRSK